MKNNANKNPLSSWCAEDRPSYKLENHGVRHLTTTELLSVIIGTGINEPNPVDIARELMDKHGNSLTNLSNLTTTELCEIDGIGISRARMVLAALELGRRRFEENVDMKPELTTATRIYNVMAPLLSGLDREEFWVLLMNNSYKLLKKIRVSFGGITEVLVDIRVILKEALLSNATIIAACHNHPSGRLRPSKADDDLTLSLKKACDVMRIHMLDHIIVCDGNYYSYHENGRL